MSRQKTPEQKAYKALNAEDKARCDAMDAKDRSLFIAAIIAADNEARNLAIAQKTYDCLSDADRAKCDALEGEARAVFLAAASEVSPASSSVEVRVLANCHYGKCNEVVKIPKGELKTAEASGLVDSEPAAVKAGNKGKG